MANFYVNLIDGNDTTGNGTIATPWKTISKATGISGARTIGDAVYVTKTPGSITLVGTGTAKNDVTTITTTADYTASLAVKDVISVNADGFPWAVITAITATTITVSQNLWFDPGTDTDFSTVNLYKIPFIDTVVTGTNAFADLSVSGNEIVDLRLNPFDFNETYGYNILISCGWNTDFTLQDGYTHIRNTSPVAGAGAGVLLKGLTGVDGYKVTRMGGVGFNRFYLGTLGTENRMVFEDCIMGYSIQATPMTACYMKNCKSYIGASTNYLNFSTQDSFAYGNTNTETNVMRPMIEDHKHYLGYREFAENEINTPAWVNNRISSRFYWKNTEFKSAQRTTQYVAGASNIGKFAIINSAVGNIYLNPTVTKPAAITGPIMRLYGVSNNINNNKITVDGNLLNALTSSQTFTTTYKFNNYVTLTAGDILTLPGTVKSLRNGDNGGVIPYCNNVIINGDGTRYQWDGYFVSNVDNIVYNTGTNSMKFTKVSNYIEQQTAFAIGEVEVPTGARSIAISFKTNKEINPVIFSAYLTPITLGQGFFALLSTTLNKTNYQWSAVAVSGIGTTEWQTLTINLPVNTPAPTGKCFVTFANDGGNMLNGDSIWIDSIVVS